MYIHKMSGGTVAALTMIVALSTASIAVAGQQHLKVGDLSRPAAARAFDGRLTNAVRRVCADAYRSDELAGRASCEAAARADALAQLTLQQRQAFEDGLRVAHGPALAAR